MRLPTPRTPRLPLARTPRAVPFRPLPRPPAAGAPTQPGRDPRDAERDDVAAALDAAPVAAEEPLQAAEGGGGGAAPAQQPDPAEDPLTALRAAHTPSTPSGPPSPPGNTITDVLAEAKLIEWPSLTAALKDTALVVGIVAGSAVVVFVINSLLTELSKTIY